VRAVLPTKNGHRRMPGLTLMVSLSLLANMETTVPMFLNEVIAHSLEVLRANAPMITSSQSKQSESVLVFT